MRHPLYLLSALIVLAVGCAPNYRIKEILPISKQEKMSLTLAPIHVNPQVKLLSSANLEGMDSVRQRYLEYLQDAIVQEMQQRSAFGKVSASHASVSGCFTDTAFKVDHKTWANFRLPCPHQETWLQDSCADITLFVENLCLLKWKGTESFNFKTWYGDPIELCGDPIFSITTDLRRMTQVSFSYLYWDNRDRSIVSYGMADYTVTNDLNTSTSDDDKEVIDDAVDAILCDSIYTRSKAIKSDFKPAPPPILPAPSLRSTANLDSIPSDTSVIGRERDSIVSWYKREQVNIAIFIADSMKGSMQYPRPGIDTVYSPLCIYPDGQVYLARSFKSDTALADSSRNKRSANIKLPGSRFPAISDTSFYSNLFLRCYLDPIGLHLLPDPKIVFSRGIMANMRSKASIQDIVVQNMPSLVYAYNKRLKNNPSESGMITVKFAINDLGKIVYIRICGSTIHDADLEYEVLDKIRTWTFPRISKVGDVTEVTYPFQFTP